MWLDSRVEKLEHALADIQSSLKTLLVAHRPPALREGREPAETAAASASAAAAPKRRVKFSGLDPGVVRSALQSGVPEAHLEEVAALLSNGVAEAAVKSTKICSQLAKQSHKKKRDPLEFLLDTSGSHDVADGSGSVASKKSYALKMLKRKLVEDPSSLYQAIESNMLSDFSSRAVLENPLAM